MSASVETKRIPPERSGFLRESGLRKIFSRIESAGGEVRVVGGAVRNALMDEPIGEVDLATTLEPSESLAALSEAGEVKAIPTALDHGTIIVVCDGWPYEVTSLREDVETDGRHAKVRFGGDWVSDARRRDFTINALYCDGEGRIFDPLGSGLDDIEARVIRFIGDARQRILEDRLRILRFFRFFAHYGSGDPDAEGLRACEALKDGISFLAAERIWMEFKKLLKASDPSASLRHMQGSGVLPEILPETGEKGIDLLAQLIKEERELGWSIDPVLRLMALVQLDFASARAVANRLKFSHEETERLTLCYKALSSGPPRATPAQARRIFYYGGSTAIRDWLRILLAEIEALKHAKSKKH